MRKSKQILTEKKVLKELSIFFENKTANQHLTSLDRLMELGLSGQTVDLKGRREQFFSWAEEMRILFKICQQLDEHPEVLVSLGQAYLDLAIILREKRLETDFVTFLNDAEVLDPIQLIKELLQHTFDFTGELKLNRLLKFFVGAKSPHAHLAFSASFVGIKKLIEACWLLHQVLLLKNSFKANFSSCALVSYALTDPLLFDQKCERDPYLLVESFFDFTNLSGYREELKLWYSLASNEGLVAEKPANLLFLYHQYLNLLQGGYLIIMNNLAYQPKNLANGSTFGEWLLSTRDRQIELGELALSDESVHLMSMEERNFPLAYIRETLSISHISILRLGLKEWLEAGLSKRSSIYGLNTAYAFEQYLTLQKLTEAFYLIVTAEANAKRGALNSSNHEK